MLKFVINRVWKEMFPKKKLYQSTDRKYIEKKT